MYVAAVFTISVHNVNGLTDDCHFVIVPEFPDKVSKALVLPEQIVVPPETVPPAIVPPASQLGTVIYRYFPPALPQPFVEDTTTFPPVAAAPKVNVAESLSGATVTVTPVPS